MDIQKKGEVVGKTDDKTVNVGDTINYTLTMKVPDTTGYDSYVYKITDEMTKGLKFNNDIKVTVGTDKTPIAKGNYTLTLPLLLMAKLQWLLTLLKIMIGNSIQQAISWK